jgi:hypothetical protein
MTRRFAALLTIVVLAAGCAAGASPGGIPHPTGANDLVLRIDVGGGLMGPSGTLGQIPMLSIYGDGRVIVTGPQIELYPGPALPNVITYRISEEGLQKILENAEAAGLLGPDAHYDYPFVADGATTTFTVVARGATHVISAYHLAEPDPGHDGQLDPDVVRARGALLAFEQRVSDIRGFLGPTVVMEPEAPYQATGMRIYAMPAQPEQGGGIEANFQDWPLSTPLSAFGAPTGGFEGMRCGTVTGDELKTLTPLLQAANQATLWRSAGATYQLILRPLLPDESGCPAPNS